MWCCQQCCWNILSDNFGNSLIQPANSLKCVSVVEEVCSFRLCIKIICCKFFDFHKECCWRDWNSPDQTFLAFRAVDLNQYVWGSNAGFHILLEHIREIIDFEHWDAVIVILGSMPWTQFVHSCLFYEAFKARIC